MDGPAQVRAAREALTTLQRVGKAALGDKTMLDAFVPCVEALEAQVAGAGSVAQMWQAAAEAAEAAAEATKPLRPRIGRARPLADRSVGHADPGAVSFACIVRTISDRMNA